MSLWLAFFFFPVARQSHLCSHSSVSKWTISELLILVIHSLTNLSLKKNKQRLRVWQRECTYRQKLAALPLCLCQGTKRILTRSKWSAVMHVLLMKFWIAVINVRVSEWRLKRITQGFYTLIILHWGIIRHLFPKEQTKWICCDNAKVLLMTTFYIKIRQCKVLALF